VAATIYRTFSIAFLIAFFELTVASEFFVTVACALKYSIAGSD
jgi:hypothetical protein